MLAVATLLTLISVPLGITAVVLLGKRNRKSPLFAAGAGLLMILAAMIDLSVGKPSLAILPVAAGIFALAGAAYARILLLRISQTKL